MLFSLVSPTLAMAAEDVTELSSGENYVTVSVEKFTLGQGYIIEPVRVPFEVGDNAAEVIIGLLGEDRSHYRGSFENGFYLASVYDHDPGALQIPSYILDAIGGEDRIGDRADASWLEEFDYTSDSGWMYAVNDRFPNVGAAELRVETGDVIRWQFTVYGLGADLGSTYDGSEVLINPANKDALTAKVAEINSAPDKWEILADSAVQLAYDNAYQVLTNMESSQELVDAALTSLIVALDTTEEDDVSEVNTGHLERAIEEAEVNQNSVQVSIDGSDVNTTDYWVIQEELDALVDVIVSAQQLIADLSATQEEVNAKVLALDQAQHAFEQAKKPGLFEENTQPEHNVTFTVAPKTVTLEVYKPDGQQVDIGAGEEDIYKIYTAYLPVGEYRYRGIDPEGLSVGGGVLTVTDESNQAFELRQLNLKASNAGWNVDEDYSVKIGQNSPNDTSLTLGQKTSAGQYPVLVIAGNTYFYSFEPSEGRIAEGFTTLSSSVTVTIAASAQSVSGAIPLAREITFTVPEEATLFLGRKTKHFVAFEEIKPIETTSSNGLTIYRFKMVNNQEYNYRVSQKGKLTNAGSFRANEANESLEVTAEQLSVLSPQSILNRGTYLEGNIYLNINEQNHLKLAGPGDEFHLLTLRSWQALIEGVGNYFFEPDFHYEIISGQDVIDITEGEPGSYSMIQALNEGTAIVKVSYDAIKVNGSHYITDDNNAFSAVWPENVGLFVVTVGQEETGIATGIESNKERNQKANEGRTGNNLMNLQNGSFDADIDSVYFLDTEPGAVFTFTPSTGSNVSVLQPEIDHAAGTLLYGDGTFSQENVTSNEGGSFSVLLKEGRNIVKVEKEGLAEYQVMTARPLKVAITNVTSQDDEIRAGDEVTVLLEGLSFPANKLAGIYNFTGQLRFTSGPEQEPVFGLARQYNITTQANSLTLQIPEDVEESYLLQDGHIRVGSFGSPIGDHRNIDPLQGANPNFTALGREGYYSIFPEIVIEIADDDEGQQEEADKASLRQAIKHAQDELESVMVSADGTDLYPSFYWVTEERYNQFVRGIESAQELIADEHATQGTVDAKVLALNQATASFRDAKRPGLKEKTSDVTEQLNKHLAYLVDSVSNPTFGTAGGEWTILSLARANYNVPDGYYETYYNNVVHEVQRLMPATTNKPEGILDRNRGTEHSRLILGLTAIGQDIHDVAGYDIRAALADFDYVTRQGINGPIFALIALDSHQYDIPVKDGVANPTTREKMIDYILAREAPTTGGWSLSGPADPDITSMALQALAPYYDKNDRVKAAVDRAIAWLTSAQNEYGGYASWGVENVQSVAQVIVALTSLGIDPHTDERFIKNGHSAIDNLLTYAVPNGGFVHPKGGRVDWMATDQGTYALVAYNRFVKGQNSLYDMTDVDIVEEEPSEGISLPDDGQIEIPRDGKDYTVRVQESDREKEVSIQLPENTQARTFLDLPANTDLPNLSIVRGSNTVEFPKGIRMNGESNKVLELLTSKNLNDASLKNQLVGLIDSDRELDEVYSFFTMGGEQPVQFNGFVTLTFKGMKGNEAAFIENGQISAIQKFANEEDGLASGKNEFAYEDGNDLIVKTSHFTDFAVFSTKEKENQGGGTPPGNGGGGGVTPPQLTAQLSVDKFTINKGYVLSPTTVEFSPGETVWDVFKREMDRQGIAYQYSYYDRYNSVYVESIDGDGEFDHGSGSGWMYNVNGVYPNYGASQYNLTQGDRIQWRYTTNLGVDLGQKLPGGAGDPSGGGNSPGKEIIVDANDNNPVIEVPKDGETYIVRISEKSQDVDKITINIPDEEITVWLDLEAVKQNVPFIEVNKGTRILTLEKGTKLKSEQSKIKLFAPVPNQQQMLTNLVNKNLTEATATMVDAFEMGDHADVTLFDQSVKLQFKGASARQTGIIDHEGQWVPVRIYSSDIEGQRATRGQEKAAYAYVEEGNLVIKTNHFSTFLLYTTVTSLSEIYTDAGDVSSWAYDLILEATEKGYVNGYGDSRLNPKGKITRAEFAKLLVEVFNIEKENETVSPFNDVQAANWFYSYVNAAYASGIVSGYGDHFLPNAIITREEMATMMARVLELELGQVSMLFEDEDHIAPWAKTGVHNLASLGIMVGDAGRFHPKGTATREMAFVVAMKLTIIELASKLKQICRRKRDCSLEGEKAF
ncbi:hypothetical protein GCM10008968_36960 [Bacillus horti]